MTIVECQLKANEIYRELCDRDLNPIEIMKGLGMIRVSKGCQSAQEAVIATRDIRLQVLRLAIVEMDGECEEAEEFYQECVPRVSALPY